MAEVPSTSPFPSVATDSRGRFIVLDCLRAVAVLLVLGRHLSWLHVSHLPEGPIRWLLKKWQFCGWVGVDIFFVLSGFLVSGLLFREGRTRRVDVVRFLVRRGLKIYPAFYVLIGLSILSGSVPWDSSRLIAEVFFVQNYWVSIWPHTWTLAIEEHFYLLLALVIWLLCRRQVRTAGELSSSRLFGATLPVLAVGAGVLCLLGRVWVNLGGPFAWMTHFYPTHLRIDALFFGVLLAWAFHTRPERTARFFERGRVPLAVLGGLCVSPPLFLSPSHPFLATAGLTMISIGVGLLLGVLLTGWRRPGFPARLLARWGAHSYSVYLWHLPVVFGMSRVLEGLGRRPTVQEHYLAVGVYLLVASIFGVAMARFVEIPILALRDRWFPRRIGSLGAGNPDP